MKFDPALTKRVEFPENGGTCNTPDDVILAQTAANIRRGLPQVQPHELNPMLAILVCGGASLATTERELIDSYWAGGKIVAVNGTYNWCIERNLKPSAAIMLDAREFNARFIERPVEGCKYLLASQCHPKTFDLCRDRETHIWHACSAGQPELDLLNDYYFGCTYPVSMGTTVGIRAISLLRMLGFTHQRIFGMDSCWIGNEHHAYEQPENARDGRVPIWIRPKDRDEKAQRFICAPWHCKQAHDFMELTRDRGNLLQLDVRGPGLIATMIRTGAEIVNEGDENGDA